MVLKANATLTLLFVHQDGWMSWFRNYREIAIVVQVIRPGSTDFECICRYSKKEKRWIIAEERHTFERRESFFTKIVKNAPELTAEAYKRRWSQLLWGSSFDGISLAGAKGVARLLGFENWKKFRIEDFIVDGEDPYFN